MSDVPINKRWIKSSYLNNLNNQKDIVNNDEKIEEQVAQQPVITASIRTKTNEVSQPQSKKVDTSPINKENNPKILKEKNNLEVIKQEVTTLDSLFEQDKVSNERLKELLQEYDKNLELHSTKDGKVKLKNKIKNFKESKSSSMLNIKKKREIENFEEDIDEDIHEDIDEGKSNKNKDSTKDILKIGIAVISGFLLNSFMNNGQGTNNTSSFPYNRFR